jgi:hypothetical protein
VVAGASPPHAGGGLIQAGGSEVRVRILGCWGGTATARLEGAGGSSGPALGGGAMGRYGR